MAATRTPALNSSAATREWIDLSVPIYGGMVHWADRPPIELDAIRHVERGDRRTVLALKTATHTGTHLDGPVHFLAGSPGTDAVPLENLMGPARAMEIEDPSAVRRAELHKHNTGPSKPLLFKTSDSQRCSNSSAFVSPFVSLTEDAANLAELKTLAPGIGYLSMGSPEVHRTLRRADVLIIEDRNLSKVRLGEYEFFCLPLRIRGGDGLPLAPC